MACNEDLYKELYERMLGIHKDTLKLIDGEITSYLKGYSTVESMINKIKEYTTGGERI